MKGLIVLCVLIPFGALAQEVPRPAPIPLAELYPPLPGVEYFCTDSQGERVDLGGVICVTASCQTWMARCEMASSNRMAMWRKLQDGCPAVSLVDRLKDAG